MEVNYEKSEIAFIGSKKGNINCQEGYKWIDLCSSSIKILGIYFSYNQVISKQENYDRTLSKLQTMINMWKSRCLTPYGKTTVLKSLALPKILY